MIKGLNKFCMACGMLGLLGSIPLQAQQAVALKQVSMKRWNIPPANYSGITPLGGDRYAVVSDKEASDGFYEFVIRLNLKTGEIEHVQREGFRTSETAVSTPERDCEGVAYFPERGSVFISGEGDQQILEYDSLGIPTGRGLAIPDMFGKGRIQPNYGFEALGYSDVTARFWTTTENALKADRETGDEMPFLRLQSFGKDLQVLESYGYRMELRRTRTPGRIFVYGVSAMTALPDGRVLVLEREANIPKHYIGSRVDCRLFVVNPSLTTPLSGNVSRDEVPDSCLLPKTELWHGVTRLNLTRRSFANYEGMCLGPRLNDGRQTLLLLNDSQAGYKKGPISLKDYIQVLLLPEGF